MILCSYGLQVSLNYSIQTDSGTHPASYPMSTVGSFPGGKVQEPIADHSPPSSVDVKIGGAIFVSPRPKCLHGIVLK
jgi:hypothetical protein